MSNSFVKHFIKSFVPRPSSFIIIIIIIIIIIKQIIVALIKIVHAKLLKKLELTNKNTVY